MTPRLSALRALLVCAAAARFLLSASAEPAPSHTSAPQVRPGLIDVLEADPRNLMYSYGLAGTDLAAMRANAVTNASATFSVVYDAGFDAQPAAKAAFQAAVDIWSNVVSSPVPIRIRAQFTTLGSTTLGSAGPSAACTVSGGVSNTYYASALADKINGARFCSALLNRDYEISANFNSTFSNWDFGTSGTPVSGRYNFLTVVMHEIGHGLGFYGYMTASGGTGSYSVISPYDRFAQTGAGTALLAFANPSTALGAQLVSNDTWFNGTIAKSSNGGSRPKLETRFFSGADNGFRAGSSYSHADDNLYTGTPNGLMTYALSTAEVYTDPGPIVRGMFTDIGWAVADPRIAVDAPTHGATVASSFTVSGWALDLGAATGTGVNGVQVYLTPRGGSATFLGAATYGSARSDVGAVYGSQFTSSGFSMPVSGLAAGNYRLTLYPYSTVTQALTTPAIVDVTVAGAVSQPLMVLDAPQNNSSSGRTVGIGGWAIDRGATTTTGVDAVHVYAFPVGSGGPVFLGVAAYGASRPDIASLFGANFSNSGYALTADVAPGTYDIVAFGRSTVANAFTVSAVSRVTVQATSSDPLLFVDTPADGVTVTRPFALSGWAIDRGATTGTGIESIHIWAYSLDWATATFVTTGTYGSARGDIGSIFGTQFTNAGFSATVNSSNLAAGSYYLVAFGRSTVTGAFSAVRVLRLTVQ
jgi:hypothetical protein